MIKLALTTAVLFLLSLQMIGQSIDSLKITEKDLPKDYSFTQDSKCISIQACTFYDMTDTYAALIGKVKNKLVQNFKSPKDSGSIMYFEYEDEFQGAGFVQGLLWGEDKKTSAEHPEEYYAKGKILVIWSFTKTSPLKMISKDKVKKKLK
jgi:hypothetical protein